MKFFIASKNKHKIEEFIRILKPMNIEVLSEADLDKPLTEVEENGSSFEENSVLKALSAMNETGLPSIADDSGLCVDYLNGAPGIYSARFAGEPTDNDKNNQKLLELLNGIPIEDRGAHFVSCIACVFPNGDKIVAYGKCYGKIAFEYHGTNGFGYDPLFISKLGSFGEISGEQKDSISHRGVALKNFAEKLAEYLNEV